MDRIVLDTNVLIDFFRYGRHADVVFRAGAVKHLSSVVLMELQAGAATAADRKQLGRFARVFRAANRVLVPQASVYEEAGSVLRILRARRREVVSLANDTLIALSARSIGATVVTQNRDDFLAIQSVRAFRLTLL